MLEIAAFAFIALFGAMSPGPDFAIVARHALTGSRRAALYATIGIAVALLIHVTYISFGISLFTESSFVFRLIQAAGSVYLGYLGWGLLKKSSSSEAVISPTSQKAFFSGFLTNLLNPKAILFILSLFSQFVTPETPSTVVLTYCLLISGTSLIWFGSLSLFITAPRFQPLFRQFQPLLMKTMGVMLSILAIMGFVTIFTGFTK